jgi:hypothetical protein
MAFQHARFARSGSYLSGTVGSYPTFSPLPIDPLQDQQEVIFCGTFSSTLLA